ncbi:hypothetical protein OHA25_40865 [Nonomuraea sp. NBC_00507]|uniref:hypothetical protein n=1 Tax=Nonomuraea sp. NBC_00507 TaxID=2976002 RepID=UPI002E179FB4
MSRDRTQPHLYRRVKQNVALVFVFNRWASPLAATGMLYPVWAMVAVAASATTIFLNSVDGRSRLLFAAIAIIGRHPTLEQSPTSAPG